MITVIYFFPIQTWYFSLSEDKKLSGISYEFGDGGIEKSAHLTWYPLNPTSRLDFVNQIYRSTIERHDNRIYDFSDLTSSYDTGYSIGKESFRQMAYKNGFMIAVTFEMSFQ